MDNLARGRMLGGSLTCAAEDGLKRISFGYFKIHRAGQENGHGPDLRDRPGATISYHPSPEHRKIGRSQAHVNLGAVVYLRLWEECR
ncbi:hypothetical protein PSPO01_03074 [Paraphaeosphaeria sporulosa]